MAKYEVDYAESFFEDLDKIDKGIRKQIMIAQNDELTQYLKASFSESMNDLKREYLVIFELQR